MRKILTSLIATLGITTVLLHSSTVATAKDKLSEYDKNVQTVMNECYLNTDDSLKDYIKVNDYHIVFLKDGEKINDMYDDIIDSVALIDYQKKIIYVQYGDKDSMKNNLYHELGHLLDCEHGFTSETSDFNKVWEYRYRIYSCFDFDTSYYTEDKRECFAQLYAIYKQYPDWLEKYFPTTYKYFDNYNRDTN